MKLERRTLLSIALLVLAIATVWFFLKIFIFILIALIISLIAEPIFNFTSSKSIGKIKIPNSVGAIVALLTIYSILGIAISIFIPFFAEEAQSISKINPHEILNSLKQPLNDLENYLNSFSSQPVKLEEYLETKISSLINLGDLNSIVQSIVGFTGDLFVSFFAITFFAFFFIKDRKKIYEMLLLFSPEIYENRFRNSAEESKKLLRRYFTGILIDMSLLATMVSLGLYITGIQNPFVIALFCAFMNIIPYAGPIIAAGFGILSILSLNLNFDFYSYTFPMLIKLIAVLSTCNLIDAFLIQPFIFGKTVRAHPLEIFTIILIAGTLGGIGGMMLAVPSYTVLRVIARQFLSESRFVKQLTKNL